MPKVSATTRARRLLGILHLLQPDTVTPLDTVAKAVGCTVEEVTRDLEALACCGLHPYSPDQLVPLYVEDGAVVVFGTVPALDRAVRLSAREATAIAAALQTAGLAHDDPLVSKLLETSAAAEVSAGRIASLVRTAPAARGTGAMKSVAVGLQSRQAVRIDYQNVSGEVRSRTIEPQALFNERGAWYVEAFCRLAGAMRTFRLDRIREADVLDERFVPRLTAPTGVALRTDDLPTAIVRLAPGESFSEREWPGARLAGEDAEGSLVEVPYAGTGWLARQIVARVGRAEVLEPAELREAVAELAGRGPGG